MTYFIFQFQKTLQAAAHVLQAAGGQMDYIDLLKLLYIADRECLAEEGDTITGDRVSALKKGPVLRTVLNLIKGVDSQSYLWQQYIESRFNQESKRTEVFLKKHPGEDKLYAFEKDILRSVSDRHEGKNLVEYTHTFPEWRKYEIRLNAVGTKKSYPITLEDMLEGIGKPELFKKVKRNIDEKKLHFRLFGEALSPSP